MLLVLKFFSSMFLNCIKHFENLFDVFFEVLKNLWKKYFSLLLNWIKVWKKAFIFIYLFNIFLLKTYSSCKVVSPLNIPSGKSVISLPNKNLLFFRNKKNLKLKVWIFFGRKTSFLLRDWMFPNGNGMSPGLKKSF